MVVTEPLVRAEGNTKNTSTNTTNKIVTAYRGYLKVISHTEYFTNP